MVRATRFVSHRRWSARCERRSAYGHADRGWRRPRRDASAENLRYPQRQTPRYRSDRRPPARFVPAVGRSKRPGCLLSCSCSPPLHDARHSRQNILVGAAALSGDREIFHRWRARSSSSSRCVATNSSRMGDRVWRARRITMCGSSIRNLLPQNLYYSDRFLACASRGGIRQLARRPQRRVTFTPCAFRLTDRSIRIM